MLTHSYYESDNRLMRYARALVERGDEVHVVSLRRSPEQPLEETLHGVFVHRVQDRVAKAGRSAWSFLGPLLRFSIASAWWLWRRRATTFDLVHVHNIPDFLVFSALPAKLRGARVILDIHDIVPEFFGSKFGAPDGSWLVRALLLMERASAAAADHVILANHLWLDRYAARCRATHKVSVVVNHVEESIFRPRRSRPEVGADPVIVFPGGLQWHQGLDIAIDAFALLSKRLPRARFDIYGDGNVKPQLLAQVRTLGLETQVRFHPPVSLEEVAAIMADADLGVVPKRADSFGNEAYSTKIMEFMAVGVPVIVSSTKVDRHYFDDTVVRFFPSADVPALADAMYEVLTDTAGREAMVARASTYVAREGWSRHKHAYLDLVDNLVHPSRPAVQPEPAGHERR